MINNCKLHSRAGPLKMSQRFSNLHCNIILVVQNHSRSTEDKVRKFKDFPKLSYKFHNQQGIKLCIDFLRKLSGNIVYLLRRRRQDFAFREGMNLPENSVKTEIFGHITKIVCGVH